MAGESWEDYMYMHVSIFVYMYLNMYVCRRMYVCKCVCVCVCQFMYVCVYVYTRMCVYEHVCKCRIHPGVGRVLIQREFTVLFPVFIICCSWGPT